MATILIVDDIAANRQFLLALLQHQGHQLLQAKNGVEGLLIARVEQLDLIITDVLMPVMDGYEFVRQLRLDAGTAKIPVLFYTASYGEREAWTRASSGGAAYVLRKSATPEEVIDVVGRVLGGGRDGGDVPGTAGTIANRGQLPLVSDQLADEASVLRLANARLRGLVNIGLELASRPESERLLREVCASACDLFGASYATLGIVDLAEGTVRRVVASGVPQGIAIISGEPPPGILALVVGEGCAMRGENVGGAPGTLELPANHPAVEAYLAVPIASAAHVYGWLCLVGNEGRTFTENDEEMSLALAGQIGRIYELEHEIVERKDAEAALLLSEERTRFALEAAGVGIWDMNLVSGALEWSSILEAQYGLQVGTFEGSVEKFVAQIHPLDRDELLKAVSEAGRTGADFVVEHRVIWPNGTVHWLSGAGRVQLGPEGAPLRAVGISIDVTERRTLETQYQQAQKLEAVGRLAGGIAHDFNNLLSVILGYCELLLADTIATDPRRTDIMAIDKAGQSAAGLTRQLLAFSRKQIIEPTLLDINSVVIEMRAMLGRLLGEDVNVVLALQSDQAMVVADRGQVEQVVMNLALNARDAMPAGGTLTIETTGVELGADFRARHPGLTSDDCLRLTVTDTGTGMTDEVSARLFEPFYTTKEMGRGTGLGLSTVDGIVARAGGCITVASALGHGSSLAVYLPRAEPGAVPLVPEIRAPISRTGTQTVLLVEDAEELRELTRRLLEWQGYRVLVAASAEEALDVVGRNATVDVVLTDVVMPGASGPELAKQLVELRPGLRVIFMSGYTEDVIARRGVLNPGIDFLHKPFTAEALGRKIREVLDQPALG